MTALSTYQRLALSEAAALSLRKHSSRKLLSFEQGVEQHSQARLDTLALMHRDGPGRREALAGAVNATSDSQGASERERVSDSHDARPGSKRAVQREYSLSQFRLDCETGRSPAAKCGDCSTARLPLWALSLPVELQRKLAVGYRKFAEPADQEPTKPRTMRERRGEYAKLAEARRAAKLRAAATTNDERLRS